MMKSKEFYFQITLAVILILFEACAQQVPPDGGTKDETAPKVIGTRPLNYTKNFKSEKIEIILDEYVQIKEPKNIIISPKISSKPNIQSINKKIEIEFQKKSLDSSTTYTINFANAVADIHEGKLIENYNYTFSTGTWIDSNEIKGQIIDAETKIPLKDITVALTKHFQNKDSNFYKKEISYITKTGDNGLYHFISIPSNLFEIIAFKDENNNNIIDKNEMIGFQNEPIDSKRNNEQNNIKLFKQSDYQSDKLLDTLYNTKGIIKFIIYDLQTTQISLLDKKITSYQNLKKGKEKYDTIIYYLNQQYDSLPVKFILQNKGTLDTISIQGGRIKLKSTEKQRIQIYFPEKKEDSLYIEFSIPVTEFNSDKIIIKIDTIIIKDTHWIKVNAFKYFLRNNLEKDKTYNLIIGDSATKSYDNKYNKIESTKFRLPNDEDYGTINLISSFKSDIPIIIQLIENNKIVHSEKFKQENISIKYLKPGNYTLKLIQDINENSKWDNGNVTYKIQPEPLKIINQELKIKANWETEIFLTNEDIKFN